MPIVQIWIMHMNAQNTQLMYKNVQANPEKSQKLTEHSFCSMLTLGKNEIEKRQRISFRPERWNVPYRNHHTCCEKLWFMRSLYPNLPQMGHNFYHGMVMPLHDSMPSFMNFRRILDLLELQKQVRRCLPESHDVVVFEFHPHFLHGT